MKRRWQCLGLTVVIVILMIGNTSKSDSNRGVYGSVLVFGAMLGDATIVKDLLQRGTNVDADWHGLTALHAAAFFGHKEIAELLVRGGADVNAKGVNRLTPLHMAACTDPQILMIVKDTPAIPARFVLAGRWIQKAGKSPSIDELVGFLEDRDGLYVETKEKATPVKYRDAVLTFMAARGKELLARKLTIAQMLVAQMDKPEAPSPIGVGGHERWLLQHQAATRALSQRRYFVDAQAWKSTTPLHLAASCGFDGMVEFLVAKGADVDRKDADGLTALHWAASRNCGETAELLVQKGADVNARTRAGKTALDHASRPETRAVLEKHRAQSAPTGIRRELITALKAGNADMFKILLEKGGDPSATDGDGTPLLILAASGRKDGHKRIAEILIANGADVNARKPDSGDTALHAVAYKGWTDVAEILIEKGADVNAKTNWGRKTPLDEAASQEMKSLLIQHGAKSGKETR